MIDEILKDVDKFTPATGANLVGLDDFEAPGEALYLIGHFATEAEAAKAAKMAETGYNGDRLFVYLPKGRVDDGGESSESE